MVWIQAVREVVRCDVLARSLCFAHMPFLTPHALYHLYLSLPARLLAFSVSVRVSPSLLVRYLCFFVSL